MWVWLSEIVLRPFFRGVIEPIIRHVVTSLVPAGMWRNILIGEYGF